MHILVTNSLMISAILILSKMQFSQKCNAYIYMYTNLQASFQRFPFRKYALLEVYLTSHLHCTSIALTTNNTHYKESI